MAHPVAHHQATRQVRHVQWARRQYLGPLGPYVAVALAGDEVHVAVRRQDTLTWVSGEFALTTPEANHWARLEWEGRR